jgi:hypothetical protein
MKVFNLGKDSDGEQDLEELKQKKESRRAADKLEKVKLGKLVNLYCLLTFIEILKRKSWIVRNQ